MIVDTATFGATSKNAEGSASKKLAQELNVQTTMEGGFVAATEANTTPIQEDQTINEVDQTFGPVTTNLGQRRRRSQQENDSNKSESEPEPEAVAYNTRSQKRANHGDAPSGMANITPRRRREGKESTPVTKLVNDFRDMGVKGSN